jgi:hypothetical protein
MNRAQRFFSGFLVLAAILVGAASHSVSAGEDWQPINPADLALKDNPASPGANAMILYRESIVDEKHASTDGVSVIEYYRIKIFTKEGVSQGDVEIPFFKESSDIKDVRARTIQPDGTIANFQGNPFEKTLVKATGVKYLAKTFTLPDVQPGSIIEYRYRNQFKPGFLHDKEWILTSDLYTREGHFTFQPFNANWDNHPLFFRQYGVTTPIKPEKENGGYKLVLHDIPGIPEESYMPPTRTLQQRLEFYYRSEDDPGNETTDHYWARMNQKLNGEFDHFIDKKSALEKELAKTVDPKDAPEVKVRKIYARVQQIRNLSMEQERSEKEQKKENIKKTSSVEDVLNHGYGYGSDINALFVGLCRTAGFSSNVVMIAPRDTTIFLPNLQDMGQLSDDIVWVKAGDKEYYLDPALPSYPFGILPWFETDTRGLRVGGKTADIVAVPASLPSDSALARHVELALDEEGSATGTVSVDFKGMEAAATRERFRKSDENGRKKELEDKIHSWLPNGASFDLTKIDNWDKNTEPLHVEGTLKMADLASAVGHRMIVPATIFQSEVPRAFDSATRKNAIYFRCPFIETDSIHYTAPAGFKIGTLPPAKEIKTSPVVGYSIAVAQQGEALEVKREFMVNGIIFDVKYYGALRAFFNTVKSDDQAQIVLQRAESAKNN